MACFVFSAEHMLAWADKDLFPGQSSHARRRGEGTSTLHRGLRQRGTSPSFLRPSPAQTDRQTGSRGETATRGTGDPERAEGVVSPARRRPSTERKTKREGRRSMRKRGHAGSGQLNKTTHQSPPARPEHFAMQRVPLPRPPPLYLPPPPPRWDRGWVREGTRPTGQRRCCWLATMCGYGEM